MTNNIFQEYKLFDIDPISLRSENFYQDLIAERKAYWKERRELIKDDNSAQCTLCDSNDNHLYLEYYGYKLFQCESCHAIFANIVFNEKYNQLIYDNDMYEENTKREILDTYQYRKEKFGKERFEYITNKCEFSPGKILLDLGCGPGYFLKYLDEQNIQCKGLELTQYLVDICKNSGLNVSQSTLEKELDQQYDIITMFDVLEHLHEPIDFFKLANRKIKKGGHILAFTPNIHSFAFYFQKGKQNLLSPYEHVLFYSKESLDYLAEQTGFAIVSIEFFGLDLIDYFSMKGSEDCVNYNEKLSEIIPYMQALIDKEKISNHMRVVFKKI
jgi:2-polyprenyl-3-methyl-5-hydroxy-6-metoxy-1,4-benzoquinol methylase